MKFSKYNFVTPCEDKYLIYNFVTTSFVALDADQYKYMVADNSFGDHEETLKKAGLIVEDDFDEDKFVEGIIKRQIDDSKDEFDGIVVLTTTACNAQCFYCYQQRLKPITMDLSTAGELTDFICRQWHNGHGNKQLLTIRWFGGEPLVNATIIDEVCRRLQDAGIPFQSKMITNGSLFNAEMLSRAKVLWNLSSLQITLDGLGEDYTKIKNYKGGNVSFEQVIANIHALLNRGVRVSIRINYSVDDIDRAKRIIDFLDGEFSDRQCLHVYCAALREIGKRAIADFYADESPQLELLKYLHEHGFVSNIDNLLPRMKAFPCEAWSPKMYFVFPNGKIFKCQHTISDNDFAPIGSVGGGTVENTSIFQIEKFERPQKCRSCYAFVFCRGGCLSIREQGQYMNGDCYTYKNSLDGLLRLYYKFYKEVNRNGSNSLGDC